MDMFLIRLLDRVPDLTLSLRLMAGKQRRARRTTRTVTAAVVTVAVVAAASVTLWLRSDHHATTPTARAEPGDTSSSPAPTTPDAVAKAFLAAWASGTTPRPAPLTDNATPAGPRLQAVIKSLKPHVH